MVREWLSTDWQQAGLVVASSVGILAAVVVVVRVAGLRSFSKMSSFDFAITVATGSIIATTAISPSASLANGALGVGVLYLCQWCIAQLRRRTSFGSPVFDNRPLLLMVDGAMIEEHLTSARVTHDDVRAKLREANVLRLEDVRAVVLETTGDVTVLHGAGPVDEELLHGIRGTDLGQPIESADVDTPVRDLGGGSTS